MSTRFGNASSAGLSFFSTVIWINVVFFSVVGLAHFSTAITEEKEEQTLGLLRMTNLNPLSILLGKSTNRLFVALFYLAAQFPFTLLAVTLGGVANSQIIAAYVALAAYVILVANLALLFSVLCRRSFAAALFTFVSLAGSSVLIAIFYSMARAASFLGQGSVPPWTEAVETLGECTVAYRLTEVLRTGFNEGPLCPQVYSNIAAAFVLFLLSWILFERATRNQLGTDAGPSRPVGTSKPVKGRRKLFSPGRPGVKALFWKDWHFIHNGKTGILLRSAILGALFFLVIPGLALMFASIADFQQRTTGEILTDMINDIDDYGASIFTITLILLILQICVSAGRIFREEIRWQTLSSLAMLPKSMRAIAYEKIGAAFVSTAPFFLFMALGFLLGIEDFADFFENVFEDADFFAGFVCFFVYAFGQIILATHVIAWLSLRLKWGAFALGIFIMVIANMIYFMILAFGAATGSSGEEILYAFFIIGGLGALGISAGLHDAIGKGLVAQAAKE